MNRMTRKGWVVGALAALCVAAALCRVPTVQAARHTLLHKTRLHPDDLEIGGDLAGVQKGETRFVTYADLLTLPQETYTVSTDTNFVGTVTISGVALEKLPALLGAAPGAAMVIAVCDDSYNAHYPAEYFSAHHPVLVLRVNGLPPAQWPKGSDGSAMGPYMISHPSFTPAFHMLAHTDEQQVPWGVLRLDFRNELEVYAPIVPRNHVHAEAVHDGYAIARQNCFRCHASEGEGGTKSPVQWDDIAGKAVHAPGYFDAYVTAPKKINPDTQMAASPQYDVATLAALRAYFATFKETRP